MEKITMRIRQIILSCALPLLLASCFGGDGSVTTGDKIYRPTAKSRTQNTEAAKNFDMARVLWKDSETCSDPKQAIVYLNKALALDPKYADAYLRRGMAKSDMYDWDGAFDDLTQAIRLHPTPEAYAFRGLVSMRGGNGLGARKDYDRSIELNSSQYRAWNFRGGLNMLEGQTEAACQDFKKGCSNGDCTGLESAKKNEMCK